MSKSLGLTSISSRPQYRLKEYKIPRYEEKPPLCPTPIIKIPNEMNIPTSPTPTPSLVKVVLEKASLSMAIPYSPEIANWRD